VGRIAPRPAHRGCVASPNTIQSEADPALAAVDGDAGSYLEELLEAHRSAETQDGAFDGVAVELAGPHLRLAGSVELGRFRRLSDLLNHHEGPLRLHAATVLRRNGTATKVTTPSIWVNLGEVTLVGQPGDTSSQAASPEMRIEKESRLLIVVTPGHTLTGEVFVPVGGSLDAFIESPDPSFVPMRDVRTRSLADRRIITRYGFALLNRRHVVAATEALPGTLTEGRVL
jgi:hypothetical protein